VNAEFVISEQNHVGPSTLLTPYQLQRGNPKCLIH